MWLPFRRLSLILVTLWCSLPRKDLKLAYSFILDKFKIKLTIYKANTLSHAARVELINSVFASIPVYYISNIIFSKKKILAKVTAIIRTFWWKGATSDQDKKKSPLSGRLEEHLCPKN